GLSDRYSNPPALAGGCLVFYTANQAKISSEVGGILMLVFPIIYGGLLEGSNLQGTLGKKVFQIKVFRYKL
ncbi:MAG: hypothetical protein P9F75_04775, partial [Candidatus Contendobacter sp.]|nr:hypothetical protein [Candidatus Contendobacter sp.]